MFAVKHQHDQWQKSFMITSNVLLRVFNIEWNGSCGTAFTLEHKEKQYLITARHVINGFAGGKLNILHSSKWLLAKFDVVGVAAGEIDVAVLAPAQQLSPAHPMPAGTSSMILGQSVYFLGFPYGLRYDAPESINNGFPLPLVKGGVLSTIPTPDGKILVDGHNNPGFSGGPVVFIPKGLPPGRNSEFCVAGVVAAYPAASEPVYDRDNRATELFIKNNPGILIAYDIRYAIDLIERNPIGFPVGKESGS